MVPGRRRMSLVLIHKAETAVSASSYSACIVSKQYKRAKTKRTLARFLTSLAFFSAASAALLTFFAASSLVSSHSFLVFCQSFSASALAWSQSFSSEGEESEAGSAGRTLIWWQSQFRVPLQRGSKRVKNASVFNGKLTLVVLPVSSSPWKAPSRSSWLGSGISPAGTGGQGQRSRPQLRAARAWEQAAVRERSGWDVRGVGVLTVVLGDFGVRHCGLLVRSDKRRECDEEKRRGKREMRCVMWVRLVGCGQRDG